MSSSSILLVLPALLLLSLCRLWLLFVVFHLRSCCRCSWCLFWLQLCLRLVIVALLLPFCLFCFGFCSTSPPGGNQVDGLPPVWHTAPRGYLLLLWVATFGRTVNFETFFDEKYNRISKFCTLGFILHILKLLLEHMNALISWIYAFKKLGPRVLVMIQKWHSFQFA